MVFGWKSLGNFMGHSDKRCILWVGDKHSGKTTAVTKLTKSLQQQDYTIGGILAPSIYKDGQLIGFDIVDIKNNFRIPLAVRDGQVYDIVPYRYYHKGLKLGHSALSLVGNKSANLMIVDEYGPLELSGKGWRFDVDRLLRKSYSPILLVVRRELADKVRKLYARYISLSLEALGPKSIDRMLVWLKE
jgi:nucleoside-triphosphatase THEP1